MSARVLEKPCVEHGFSGNGHGYAAVRRPFPDLAVSPGHKNPKGLLHRWVFYETHGFLPPVVMHACDNTRCIEVTHLVAGDQDANNKDRASKGRSAPWVPTRQKLRPAQVREIRERFALRAKRDRVNGPLALAREFEVDINVIYQITSGRTYRNVVA